MKKILLIAAALFVGAVSFAQETNLDAEGNIQKGPYETNGFWDNWFVGGGIGVSTVADSPVYIARKLFTGNGAVGNFFATPKFPFFGEIFAGKWFEPSYGVRASFAGVGTAAPVYGGADNDVTYVEFRGDILLNVLNLWKGYSATRVFNPVLYASLGLAKSNGLSPAAGFGFMPQFKLGEKLGAYIDIRWQLVDAKAFGYLNTGAPSDLGGLYSGSLGLTYAFDRTDWTRKSSTVAAYAAAVAAAEAAAAQAKAAADAAKAAAEAQQEKATQEVEQVKEELAVAQNQSNYDGLFDEPIIAYFQIGKSTLSSLEKEHVKYVAKNLIARGENVKFTLSGNADSKTGTAKRNMELSKERADYVYKMMTEELGIDGSRFTVKYNGGNDIFDSPELNRAVIIEKD